jgi:hypothetical protein
MEEQRMNIEELLLDWDNPKTFKELPFREDMKYCTVTIDEPEKKGLEELINGVRNKINSKVKSIRKGMERGR